MTLKSDGALRGCIGHVEGALPLWQTVRDNALAAAFEDPRFPPLSGEELPGLKLEISVLTPLRAITSPGDIEVGRDGLMVTRGWRRGLLLPQVATEQGWDRETFLDHTCQKAGMSPGCWRDPDTTIQVFRAQVFGEE